MSSDKKFSSAFTLIEILIVVAIIALIGVVTFLSLSGRGSETDLTNTATQIVATLRDAQGRSMTQMQGASWGVHFANPTNTAPFYAIFYSSYSPTTTAGYYRLPTTVGYLPSTIPLGSSVDVTFSQVSGLVSTPVGIGFYTLRPSKSATATSSFISVALTGSIAIVATSTASTSTVATALSPTFAMVGGAQFTLTVTGANFVSSSTVNWNGSALATTYVSSNSLNATVPAANITSAGTPAITVVNPGTSNTLFFNVNNPAPTLTSIGPVATTTGVSQFTLTLTGTNFISGSIVNWNGSALATTYVSATSLTATVPAANVASAGTATVTVVNAAPGGGTTSGQTFTINNPVPTLTSISPTSTTAGGSQFTLTVTGTSFVTGATVNWNGSALATTYVSATSLTATVPAADIASAGTALITVTNPTPGGGTSGSVTFTINAANNPVPTLTSISPTSTTAGGSQFTLTVTGTNFVSSSTVQWNGASLTTTVASSTSMSATVPAADIASAGTATVTLFTPTPGGGTSSGQTFTINANASPIAPSEDSPLNSTIGLTVNPVFKMTATDPNADLLKYKVTIYSNNICSATVQTDDETASQVGWSGQNASSSSAFTSGTQGTFTTQTALAAATTYYWKASAIDPWGSNTWTDSVTCNTFATANPVPTLASMSPTSTTAGGSQFTLTVTGTNFVSGSVVQWNGVSLATAVVSATSLTATVPAADIASAGTATVTVFTPTPGGGTSGSVTFTIKSSGGSTLVLDATSTALGARSTAKPFVTSTHTVTTTANPDLFCIVAGGTGVPSMSYNGVAMNQIAAAAGGTQDSVYIFDFIGPPSGAHVVSTSYAASTTFVTSCVSFAGADQTTGYDATSSKVNISPYTSTPNTTTTSQTGEFVLDGLAVHGTVSSSNSGQTTIYSGCTANPCVISTFASAAAGSTVTGYTLSALNPSAEAAVSIKAAP